MQKHGDSDLLKTVNTFIFSVHIISSIYMICYIYIYLKNRLAPVAADPGNYPGVDLSRSPIFLGKKKGNSTFSVSGGFLVCDHWARLDLF